MEERAVPQSDIPGEVTSPTQPFSSLPPLAPLAPPSSSDASGASAAWRRSEANARFCRTQLAALRYEGIFTPPSVGGTLLYPGSLGGVNWGSAAIDPNTGVLYANNNRLPFAVWLLPRNTLYGRWHYSYRLILRDWSIWLELAGVVLILFTAVPKRWNPGLTGLLTSMAIASVGGIVCLFPIHYAQPHFGDEISPQRGSPYLLKRAPVVDHDGNPCTAPPWGTLTALNLNTGRIEWQSNLGNDPSGYPNGGLSLGGPIVTASGLVFTGATLDAHLRAFDATTGALLWSGPLPAAAQSTPMTYTLDGRQFVVIAAGGHAGIQHVRSDALVAFALDR